MRRGIFHISLSSAAAVAVASIVVGVDDLVCLGGWYFGAGDGGVERFGNA